MKEKKRLELVDSIRGFSIISMILFHTCWIFSYFGILLPIGITLSSGFVVWERTICCPFIFISGFSFCLGRHQLRNGLKILGIGVIISLVSYYFLYDLRDIFGVLWIIGLSILILIPVDKLFGKKLEARKIASVALLVTSIILFLFTFNCARGYFGSYIYKILLPQSLYKGYFMTFLGFMDPSFYSVDYFPVIPWLFLDIAGYFTYRITTGSVIEEKILVKGIPFLKTIGKHSLLIYIVHPVVIFVFAFIIRIIMGLSR